jgi:hypothetical protein
MRRLAKAAWNVFFTAFLTTAFFLFFVSPARAPYGGKNSLGGRTIASMQEKDFDHRLLHFQLCYGVKFSADSATLERRRVCKAMLVSRLDQVLSVPGAYFRSPMEFRCENTVFVRSTASDQGVSVVLKPNEEFNAIDKAIAENLERAEVGESTDRFARQACEFLTSCKLAMTGTNFSFRKLAACFSTGDLTRRKILLDEVGAMVFRAKQSQAKILYAELLEDAHK